MGAGLDFKTKLMHQDVFVGRESSRWS